MSDAAVCSESPVRLLVWDAPNIDVALGTLLGGRAPMQHEGPKFERLARWLVERAASGEVPEACVFTNINTDPERLDRVRGWIDFLRNVGFAVFAKPKVHADDDIDGDLLEHIRSRAAARSVVEVLVASADQFRDFGGGLDELAEQVPLTVLGFREFNQAAIARPGAGFIDLEEIDGLFEKPLVREVPLEHLPEAGAWLRPRHSLLELYSPTP